MSFGFFSCTFKRFVPIWKPCIALIAAWADSWLSYDTKPKHFDKFVCLSMKTLADITVPNGKNVDAKSVSVNSCGKWYIKRFEASAMLICFWRHVTKPFCCYVRQKIPGDVLLVEAQSTDNSNRNDGISAGSDRVEPDKQWVRQHRGIMKRNVRILNKYKVFSIICSITREYSIC